MSDREIPWSMSMLATYETCAHRYKLKYILRIPEPERPLPKGKTEHANDRGSRIHQGNEDYVKGDIPLMPIESEKNFGEDIDALRDMYGEGRVMLEHDWCFDADWMPCERKDRDSIFIIDVGVWIIPEVWLLVIDYKTGRPYPVKHMDQMKGYALAAYRRYPMLEKVTTELWYLDQDDISAMTFTPASVNATQNSLTRRVARMRDDTIFKPASHMHACRYCPYKDQCEFAETGAKPQKQKPQSAVGWMTEWKI